MKEQIKTTVDGEGKEIPEFQLKDWFPDARQIKLQTGDWNSRFNLTHLWALISKCLLDNIIHSNRA